jgi:hypothetical protein
MMYQAMKASMARTMIITVGGERANDHGRQDVSGESELDLELDDFHFEPPVLTGAAGESLLRHLENEGSTEHNFSVSDQGIDQRPGIKGRPRRVPVRERERRSDAFEGVDASA